MPRLAQPESFHTHEIPGQARNDEECPEMTKALPKGAPRVCRVVNLYRAFLEGFEAVYLLGIQEDIK